MALDEHDTTAHRAAAGVMAAVAPHVRGMGEPREGEGDEDGEREYVGEQKAGWPAMSNRSGSFARLVPWAWARSGGTTKPMRAGTARSAKV